MRAASDRYFSMAEATAIVTARPMPVRTVKNSTPPITIPTAFGKGIPSPFYNATAPAGTANKSSMRIAYSP